MPSHWRVKGVILVLVLQIVGTLFWAVRERVMEARLVRSVADAVPNDPSLVAFAVPRGRQEFARRCAGCHGAEGKGDPVKGAPDLTDNEWLYGEGLVSDIERVARYGIRAHRPGTWNLAVMPAFGTAVPSATEKLAPLSPPDIRDVTDYLFTIEGREADPSAAARGAAIFAGRGACYDCHGRDARGDPGIGAPDLRDRTWLYGDGSPEAIFLSIAKGRQGICPGWADQMTPAEIRAAAVYVYTLSHPTLMASTGTGPR